MATRILSFGFKYGTPMEADLVLDVRFLENPYFVPALKSLPGTDPAVVKFVLDLPETKEFLARTSALLSYVMPKYEREGKSYLTIAIGCTGGRHRSVVLADVLARTLEPVAEQSITVVHRDVLRRDGWMRNDTDPPPSRSFTPSPSESVIERLGVAQPLGQPALGQAAPAGTERGSR
jgi:UPF0042 nucleotide-binding protein